MGLPWWLSGKDLPTNAGDLGSIPAEGNGTPLRYSCVENLMDRGAWWATVHEVAELDTTEQLTHTHTHTQLNKVFLNLKSMDLNVLHIKSFRNWNRNRKSIL